MATSGLQQRKVTTQKPSEKITESNKNPSNFGREWQAWMGSGGVKDDHPLGAPKHNSLVEILRILGFAIYFFGSCVFIHLAQLLGVVLYVIDKDLFYAWMAMTKGYFGLLLTTMTQWWSPTVIRVSGDKSMAGLIKQDRNGMLELKFGERAILMANHQLYTDWLYLWWISYTNNPSMHGHIYIILKESLKYAPMLGPGMMFFGFIFMARKWATDQDRMRHRLQKLVTRHPNAPNGPSKEGLLDPMWLLIFPEGTNVSGNTRKGSVKFAEKSGITDMKHQLLPRSTGLQFCLEELKGTVDYLYDCTIGYEGIPAGQYGQDIFTLRSVYFQGRPPKSVNMHWRRFAIKDIPYHDKDSINDWIMARWREKDELMEAFNKTGKFPADADAVHIEGGPHEKEWKTPYINTEVKTRSPFEFLQMFAPVAAATTVGRVGVQILDRFLGK